MCVSGRWRGAGVLENQNNNDMKLKAKPILPILQQYSFDYKIHNMVVHVTNKYLEILVG